MAEKNYLSENLRLLRLRMKYTQQQVADFLKISQPAYLKYENGTTDVSMENGVSEYDLLENSVEQMQVQAAFAFRKNGENVDLEQIAQFQKIVNNYLEMTNELEKYKHKN
jgi:transcriptional regulator with XRE-family HTH domain